MRSAAHKHSCCYSINHTPKLRHTEGEREGGDRKRERERERESVFEREKERVGEVGSEVGHRGETERI